MLKALHQIQSSFGEHMAAPKWVENKDIAKAFSKGADGKWKANKSMISDWIQKPDPRYSDQDIQDRLYHAMLNESVRCLDEGIVLEPGLLDLAMVYGTGFPPYRGGPSR